MQFVKYLFILIVSPSITKSIDPEDVDNKIVGGSKVTSPIPYQVSLQHSRNNAHFCGGSIISSEHVLTAAHCLKGQNKNRISVLAGVTNLKQKTGSRHSVSKFVIHKNYKELVRNDIGVMKISPPFTFDNKTIGQIGYKSKRKIGGGESVMLTGWGSISPSTLGPLPEDLQFLKLRTLTNSECNRFVFNVSNTEICALRSPLNGACAGDSGGPLVLEDQNTQVGVVSYGTMICGLGLPDVYTRVSILSDWIDEQVKKM
ncbi:hypothetical protein ACFFRR_000480 [Megaselia abdita]